MSKAQQLLARDQLTAIAEEEARRKRAVMRQSYGNKFSSINLNRMRQKQTTSGGDLIAAKASTMDAVGSSKAPVETIAVATAEPPLKEKDPTLRRIASSFAHVRDLVSGSSVALPLEDSEDDAREERAEVLICSQTMPLPTPPSDTDEFFADLPPTCSPQLEPESESTPELEPKSKPELKPESKPVSKPPNKAADLRLSKAMPEPLLPTESRAFERWQQLGSTVSALFRARRYIDASETPMAQTRRLREQRELLEAFTRPFLYDAYRRQE
ncbi:uncharacterized protein LOC122623231 [Drosophila teissieri]|uniref:uncharacterized protein LOC122623231 n=1 Tax=Drosophila teissieri TaxID=7243 RepID=UPI001CBA3A25|nr:uncharacterized protein LOC122623231 [Drosophila teissieri]